MRLRCGDVLSAQRWLAATDLPPTEGAGALQEAAHLLGKLSVSNRTEAAARGRELDLI